MHKSWLSYFWFYVFLFFGAIVVSPSCFKNLTKKQIVFENDFEKDDLKGILLYSNVGLINTTKIETFNGSKVLGRFNNNRVSINLTDLPQHNSMHIEFDLYIHDKWEGNLLSVNNIPDIWQIKIDDNTRLLTTFSNTLPNKQAYPSFYLYGDNPAQTNAFDGTLPGVCGLKDQKNGTSLYHFSATYPHSKSSFKVDCSDALQPFGDICLKSWSIDNLKIDAITY